MEKLFDTKGCCILGSLGAKISGNGFLTVMSKPFRGVSITFS